MNIEQAIRAWDAIGLKVTPARIREHWEQISTWKNNRAGTAITAPAQKQEGAENDANHETAVSCFYSTQSNAHTTPTPNPEDETLSQEHIKDMAMGNIHDKFRSKYLKGNDIKGQAPMVVTVDRAEEEEVGEDKDLEYVVYFEEIERGLILNKTNALVLEEITGHPETENWGGATCELRTERVQYKGKGHDAIRIYPVSKKVVK